MYSVDQPSKTTVFVLTTTPGEQCPSQRITPTTIRTRRLTVTVLGSPRLTSTLLSVVLMPSFVVTSGTQRWALSLPALLPSRPNSQFDFYLASTTSVEEIYGY
ncbi:hypothetical protein BDV3_001118 [Batrachochytrium dendrobatidis]